MDVTDQFNQRKSSLFKVKGEKAEKKEETEKEVKEVKEAKEENQNQSINESANEQEFVDGDSNKTVEETKENQEITEVSKDSHVEAISKTKKEEKKVQGDFGGFEDKPKRNDDHLNQAKGVTEETVEHIHKRINQQAEIKPENKRDFTGVFLMLALLFSFGAMAFSIVNMLAPSGLGTAYYQKGVKFLNEKNTERLMALKQEVLDSNKLLNDNLTQSVNEVKKALLQVSDNTKKLNQNMAQVQSNISNEISNQSTPDLSQLTSSISDLKASVDQIKNQTRLINVNNAFKSSSETTSSPSIGNANIQYIGNSPNGAILKVIGKDKNSKKANYITINAGDMTAYGKVSFLDDQSIVIGGKHIEKEQSK